MNNTLLTQKTNRRTDDETRYTLAAISEKIRDLSNFCEIQYTPQNQSLEIKFDSEIESLTYTMEDHDATLEFLFTCERKIKKSIPKITDMISIHFKRPPNQIIVTDISWMPTITLPTRSYNLTPNSPDGQEYRQMFNQEMKNIILAPICGPNPRRKSVNQIWRDLFFINQKFGYSINPISKRPGYLIYYLPETYQIYQISPTTADQALMFTGRSHQSALEYSSLLKSIYITNIIPKMHEFFNESITESDDFCESLAFDSINNELTKISSCFLLRRRWMELLE